MKLLNARRAVTLAAATVLAAAGAVTLAQPADAATVHCGGWTNYQKTVEGVNGEIHVPTTSTSSDNTNCSLWPGDTGNGVKALQAALRYCWGQSLGSSGIDGSYGSHTQTAVENVQRELNQDQGAGLTVDGKWGPQTRRYTEYPLFHYNSTTVYTELECTFP